jgi:radical SAM protein with 4Fe4S-binding SPASM domain
MVMQDFYKIAMAQIDPNGLCNAGCWFCPVAYSPNPELGKKNMPVDVLEGIIKQLHDAKGDYVTDNFDFIYTAHYNEVLLYKHFEEMLQIFRKYGFKTIVLTNGTPLNQAKTDIIKQYQDVVYGICFNIPSSRPEEWQRLTGMNIKMFDKLLQNINYAIEELPEMFMNKTMSIQVNGVNKFSLVEYGGWLEQLSSAPEMDLDPDTGSLATEVNGFRDFFPGLQVYPMPSLIDRAGHLDKAGVITNIGGIDKFTKNNKTKVVGCGNGYEVGGRPNGWIHINANGDMFICCNDYDFETVYGNINDKSIKDIWMSKEHKDMIQKSYDTLCRTCTAAIWSE